MNLSKANPYAVAAIAIAAALIGTVVCALSVAAAVVPQEDARADPAVGIAPVADRDFYRNGRFPEAQGEGRYRCEDGAGELRVEFAKLVPNGVYTMWHAFMAWPPTEPFIGTYDLPIGARDGSASVFVADARGNATLVRRFKPCLQLTGEHLAAELAVGWHSDRETSGPLPGEFATKSHIHMYTGLPKRSGL